MIKSRIRYSVIIVIVMLLGLASRHIHGIPLWIGDVLWALMVFYLVRWLFVNGSITFVAAVSLGFCFLIEISQLYQAVWINNIRHTIIGGLILGETFEWGDLLCYTVGVGIGVLLEVYTEKPAHRNF